MARNIKVIPSTVPLHAVGPVVTGAKRRVAAYARVSTDRDEQFTSYEAQIDYYTNYIRSRPDWEFVSVYSEMLTTSLIQMHPTCTQIAP